MRWAATALLVAAAFAGCGDEPTAAPTWKLHRPVDGQYHLGPGTITVRTDPGVCEVYRLFLLDENDVLSCDHIAKEGDQFRCHQSGPGWFAQGLVKEECITGMDVGITPRGPYL